MTVGESRFESDLSPSQGEWQHYLMQEKGRHGQARSLRTTSWMLEIEPGSEANRGSAEASRNTLSLRFFRVSWRARNLFSLVTRSNLERGLNPMPGTVIARQTV